MIKQSQLKNVNAQFSRQKYDYFDHMEKYLLQNNITILLTFSIFHKINDKKGHTVCVVTLCTLRRYVINTT